MGPKQKLFRLFLLGAGAIASILVLFFITQNYNDRRNNFVRLFPPHIAWLQDELDLGVNSFYIAGTTDQNIFLGNTTTPAYITRSNIDRIDTSRFRVMIAPDTKILYDKGQYSIDSPYINLVDLVSRKMLMTSNPNDKLYPVALPQLLIAQTVLLNQADIVCRTYDVKADRAYLKKYAITQNEPASTLELPKQSEGLFSPDGNLIYDAVKKQLVYVFRYKNQFLVIDTNLQLIKANRTLDTNTFAKVQRVYIASQNKMTMSKPPVVVNASSALWNGLLFIKSPLLSSNENRSSFKNNEPIDIYNTNTGAYLYSFYLPKFKGSTCREFTVRKNKLLALYDHYLLSFHLRL
ncbi:hypothetical protein PV783_13890 [Chitinophaga sp. CC14]|uniref:hypothetical protein n=1 Tax=Chitinophaga sp. CC14 TaxID=3029199 RepID=UPI003B779AD3